MKYSVIGSHRPESSDFLSACVGDELSLGKKETTYPGWIWCTDHRGAQAWVPKAYVSIEGARCFMTRDYVSRELELEVGDKVELLEMESGWAWVLDGSNVNGWIPMECLGPVETDDVSG
jgi:hypothetical protein